MWITDKIPILFVFRPSITFKKDEELPTAQEALANTLTKSSALKFL